MKLGDWIKERVEEIRAAHPVEAFEVRECRFDVVVDADGDVRLSGDTRIGFSVFILNERRAHAPLPAEASVDHGVEVVVTGNH